MSDDKFKRITELAEKYWLDKKSFMDNYNTVDTYRDGYYAGYAKGLEDAAEVVCKGDEKSPVPHLMAEAIRQLDNQ